MNKLKKIVLLLGVTAINMAIANQTQTQTQTLNCTGGEKFGYGLEASIKTERVADGRLFAYQLSKSGYLKAKMKESAGTSYKIKGRVECDNKRTIYLVSVPKPLQCKGETRFFKTVPRPFGPSYYPIVKPLGKLKATVSFDISSMSANLTLNREDGTRFDRQRLKCKIN